MGRAWEEAKEEKKKINKFSLVVCLIADILLIMLFLYPRATQMNRVFGLSNGSIMFMLLPMLVIDLLICVVLNLAMSKKQKAYKKIYKDTIINKIISNFYTGLEYFPEKQMPQYIYDEPAYNEYYNRYGSDDYFEAEINEKHGIQMGEVKTEKVETHTDSEGRTHTTTTTIFHGLFAKIVMDKTINSELRIVLNGRMFFNKERLKMDSTEFEKYFDVQASNKIIGMQILTADVMEELIDFQNKTKIKYDIAIINNNLYLRFHCGSMFEPQNIKKGALDRKSLETYFYMLNFTYNLSNKIINTVNETEI